jgi:hypothetical protein
MRLTTSHLLKATQVASGNHEVIVKQQEGGKWSLYLQTQTEGPDGFNTVLSSLQSSRGRIRQWKELEAALRFLDEHMPKYRVLTVHIEGRILQETGRVNDR